MLPSRPTGGACNKVPDFWADRVFDQTFGNGAIHHLSISRRVLIAQGRRRASTVSKRNAAENCESSVSCSTVTQITAMAGSSGRDIRGSSVGKSASAVANLWRGGDLLSDVRSRGEGSSRGVRGTVEPHAIADALCKVMMTLV